MHTFTKSLITGTALLAGQALADVPPPAPQPTTQPAAPLVAQSSEPLVIPDGTSIQNPGPRELKPLREDERIILGVRG